jgi:kinesin family protein C2/C3
LVKAKLLVDDTVQLIKKQGGRNASLVTVQRDLEALKLEELDVDVMEASMLTREEIKLLRNAAFPEEVSKEDTGNNSTVNGELSKENDSLRDLLREAQAQIARLEADKAENIRSNAAAMSPVPTSFTKDNALAEVASLRSKNSSLISDLESAKAKLADSEASLAAAEADCRDLKGKVKDANGQVAKMRLEGERISMASANNNVAVEQMEKKMNDIKATHAQEMEAIEKRLETEKEEVMEAMAQEVEELERTHEKKMEGLLSKIQALELDNGQLHFNVKSVQSKFVSFKRAHSLMVGAVKDDLKTLRGMEDTKMLFAKMNAVADDMKVLSQRYNKEMMERKRLHNEVQELKGNIRVYMRCRPPTEQEKRACGSDAQCVSFPAPGEIKVLSEKGREKTWEFDEIFAQDSTQSQVYKEVSSLVVSVMDGYNVCIFAYGQTGSGKTYCMIGPDNNKGVNSRALDALFQRTRERSVEWEDKITVSVLEVYNEDIHDLLNDGGIGDKLEIRQGEFGNYVPGLTNVAVNKLSEVEKLLAVRET